MDTIWQTTFSSAFSWIKMFEFLLKCHWSLFLRVELTIFQNWFWQLAWRRPGDKPLSEPMIVSLPTHICVTRPQWVNTLRPRLNNSYFADDIFKWFLSITQPDRFSIPMDMTVVHGLHKFSLQATINHHGPSMYSGHYTASINCCKSTFFCNDSKITEFKTIDAKNSSTAYVIMYKFITYWVFLD